MNESFQEYVVRYLNIKKIDKIFETSNLDMEVESWVKDDLVEIVSEGEDRIIVRLTKKGREQYLFHKL